MKTLIISAIFISSFSFSSRANDDRVGQNIFLVNDTTSLSTLSQLLSLYYDVKNALINSDAVAASAKAGLLLNAIEGIDVKTLPANEHKAFMPLQSKLSHDARHIAEVKNIDHQREHFANLSLNMYALAKATKLSAQPVYQDYCPMKKAYWLSNESTIKNPYYGNQMLDCGSVKNTIK